MRCFPSDDPAYQKRYRLDVARNGPRRRDARGYRRKLQALAVMGHSMSTMAGMVGRHRDAFDRTMAGDRLYVGPDVARDIDWLFDKLAYTPAAGIEAQRRRTRARQRGWVSAAAWEDIDNDAAPIEMDIDKQRSHVEEGAVRLEEYAFLRSQGLSEALIAQRLGIKIDSVGNLRRRLERSAA